MEKIVCFVPGVLTLPIIFSGVAVASLLYGVQKGNGKEISVTLCLYGNLHCTVREEFPCLPVIPLSFDLL